MEQIFSKLNIFIPDLYEQLEEIINKNIFIYEISQNKLNILSLINETFFILINSILRIINSKEKVYDLPLNDLLNLLAIIKQIYEDLKQLEITLNIYSKETLILKEILKLIDIFSFYKKISAENIKKIINYFSFVNDNCLEKLTENFNELYSFLNKELEKENQNNNYYYKNLSYIFIIEFKKYEINKFREFLLQIILENNNLIRYCSDIFKIILEDLININPNEMINNLIKIKEEKSLIFRKINKQKNIVLDEVIMNIFETKIMLYFESIKDLNKEILKELYSDNFENDEKFIIFGNSIKLFKQAIQFLDEIDVIDDFDNNSQNNIYLSKLYCITYVKMYLNKVIFYLKNEFYEKDEYKEIFKIIQDLKNKSFNKVIKIYISKLLYNFLNNNYEEFKKFNLNKYNLEIQKELSYPNNESDKLQLVFLMLPLEEEDYVRYLEKLKQFEILKNQNFEDCKENYDLIKRDDFDIFLTISINKIIFNISSFNYIFDKDEYKNFSIFTKSLLDDNYKNNLDFIKLLNLFFDYDSYIEKIFYNLMNENSLEIILYGFRYCIHSLENNENENLLFKSILSQKCIEIIEQSLIPGIDSLEDLHITTLETIITHLNTKNERHGCYVCSCGYYYDIDPCGFPTKNRTFKCPVCEEKIGWGPKKVMVGEPTHGMVIRPGHYRIFKDENQKKRVMKVFDEVDDNIPNKLLPDYIEEIINPIRKRSNFGFNPVSKNYFENKTKKIRNLSNIGYRLLNFISYSHLLFGYLMGYIPQDYLKNYLILNMNIFTIIEQDWKFLEEALEEKNISSIQIFMNMIFKKLSELIKHCKYLKKEEEREKFENEVEQLIEQCINDYPEYNYKYIEENSKQLMIRDYYNIETIIKELIIPNEEIYPEKDYPLFKYFILTKYKTREDFVKHIINKDKYPLINQFLLNKIEHKKMNYLPIFKEFINYMKNKYSFNISRDEAKNKILNEQEIYQTPGFPEKFDNFIKIWNEIKGDAKKFKCHPEMLVKDLNSNDKLIYFLNDDGELGYGMYIASAFQNFIFWQNSFILPIIESNNANGILHCYINSLKKEISLQEAQNIQILLIEDRFKKSKYRNLNHIIYNFSERNIFNQKGKINYSNYNSFIYNFDQIEEELGKIILPGLHLFENENDKNYIIFWPEFFKGDRSQILLCFYLKYPQKDFIFSEKQIIVNYIQKIIKIGKEKDNTEIKFREFLSSLQIIIFYLTEKIIINEEEKIYNMLEKININISNELKDFFFNEGKVFTLNKFMNIYNFFEHLCYKDLIDNLQNEYKKNISIEEKNKIINKLINNGKDNFILYNIKDFGAALRRFISRYLVGKFQTIELNEDRKLENELYREDLWPEKIRENENLKEIIEMQIKEFELTISQTFALYEIIGDDDKKFLEILN